MEVMPVSVSYSAPTVTKAEASSASIVITASKTVTILFIRSSPAHSKRTDNPKRLTISFLSS
jgi:hypothetical protein